MQIKFLKLIVENLINKQAVPIIDLLVGKKHVNEFLIAKKLGLTINQTRNILYKLSDYSLVSFIRKKDKRKGWYIYFWTLNIFQSLTLLEQNLKKELMHLENQLKQRKEKRYYVCDTCSIEVNEETALLNDFVCKECEEVYKLANNQNIILELEKQISKMKKEMQMVSAEREKEQEKIEKKKAKKIKKQEREKKAKKKKTAKKKPKTKKKKTVKKKTTKKKTPAKKKTAKKKAPVKKKKTAKKKTPAKKKSVKKKKSKSKKTPAKRAKTKKKK
jgi:transcription factor E